MMERLRRIAPLLLAVALICGCGAFAVILTSQANGKAEAVRIQDRNSLQSTLGSLGKQYLLFSLKEGLDFASTGTWNLKAGDPSDEARLKTFVDRAVLLNYGASIVNLQAQPLTTYAAGPGVPPSSDPGYKPMVTALLAQRPDVSSVMKVGGLSVVAMGVPITEDGVTRAVFVGFVRLDTSALETYVRGLHYGSTGKSLVVDSAGVVVAATNPDLIGRPLGIPQVTSAVAHARGGDYLDQRAKTVVSYAPFGLGGWFGVTVQSSNEFFGPIRSGSLRVELAILALLVVATLIVMLLGHKREAARRQFQEQLAYEAAHDVLTGLVNRSVFHERLNQALARSRRSGASIAVLYLDLDLFKAVNDTFGHDAGDQLLVEVAGRIRGLVRLEDTVARMGGDEFAILMEELSSPSELRPAANRIVDELCQPVDLMGNQLVIGTSVGIAYSRGGQDQAESFMRDADLAMYRAKDAGGSRFVFSGSPVGGETLHDHLVELVDEVQRQA